jgi:hypothetical protein
MHKISKLFIQGLGLAFCSILHFLYEYYKSLRFNSPLFIILMILYERNKPRSLFCNMYLRRGVKLKSCAGYDSPVYCLCIFIISIYTPELCLWYFQSVISLCWIYFTVFLTRLKNPSQLYSSSRKYCDSMAEKRIVKQDFFYHPSLFTICTNTFSKSVEGSWWVSWRRALISTLL